MEHETTTHFVAYDYGTLDAFATSGDIEVLIILAQNHITDGRSSGNGVIIVDNNFVWICRIEDTVKVQGEEIA